MREAPPNFSTMTKSIMEENETFCKCNEIARESWTELVELMNDAIDHVMWEAKLNGWDRIFPKYSMLNYLFSVLMPLSYSIYLNFLVGNLPVCFTQLRILLEQLAKCFLSDRDYPDFLFFQQKLTELEEQMRTRRLSLTKIVELLNTDGIAIWRSLSENWVHMKGFEKIVKVVQERDDVPGWGLTVPIGYTDTELPEIEELGKSVNQFRQILAKSLEQWKMKNFPNV
jgi:hypothetical protein